MSRTKIRGRHLLVAIVVLAMVGWLVTPIGASLATTTEPSELTGDGQSTFQSLDDEAMEPADVSSTVEEMTGESEVFLRLPAADNSGLQGDRDAVVENLKTHANASQEPALEEIEAMDGVEVENTFWIMNAILVTADFDEVALEDLQRLPYVHEIHEHHTFEVPETIEGDAEPQSDDTTYGLDQINAPDVWDEFDETGEDARVVVADTGAEPDNDAIDLAEEDGWYDPAEGTDEPEDGHGHGTHVIGTVAGTNAYEDTWIGVAPDAEIGAAKVCDDDGSCAQEDIIASFEWAVETGADIINLSLGGPADGTYVEHVYNTMEAGTLVVSSIGNDGEGTSGSPGNIWDSLASGATDEDEEPGDWGFGSGSGGELIEEGHFEGEWMDHWDQDPPEGEYVTPDAAAPGTDVVSADNDGGLTEMTGTSMSSPHKAGAAALIVAADDDIGPWEIQDLMMDTAWKPDDWDPEQDAEWYNEETERDSRYGTGIIDVHAAVEEVAADSGVEGQVTDADDGEPIEGATVEAVGEDASTTTNATGHYELGLEEGTYDITADATGYEEETENNVNVGEDEWVEEGFELTPTLEIDIVEAQPDTVASGGDVTATVEVANADTVSVALSGDFAEGDLDLTVDSEDADYGEDVAVDDGEVEIVASTPDDGSEWTISMDATADGADESDTVDLGSTEVEDMVEVGVVDDDGDYGDDMADLLEGALPDHYEAEATSGTDYSYDAYVVQNIDEGNTPDFIDETDDAATTVVYVDQWGDWADGVTEFATASDDVEGVSEADGDGGPYYEVTSTHPIFEGYSEGETVSIHDGDWDDRAWMDGTEFDVIADTTSDGGTDGPGVAVDDDTSTVMMASSGLTDWVSAGEQTTEHEEILANAVQWSGSTEDAVDRVEIEPADDDTITAGDEIDFEATAYDDEDDVIEDDDGAFTWGAEDGAISGDGLFDETDVGNYDVTASFEGVTSDVTTVTVEAADLDSVVLDPDADQDIDSGETVGFNATAVDEYDNVVEDDDSAFSWDAEGGNITDVGLFDEEDIDQYDVTAAYDDVTSEPTTVSVHHPCDADGGPGDVSDDGDVWSLDATSALQMIADGDYDECGDMNLDDTVSSADVTHIQQVIVGLEDQPEP